LEVNEQVKIAKKQTLMYKTAVYILLNVNITNKKQQIFDVFTT